MSAVLPVRIYGIDSAGKPFNTAAHTLNVSKSGAMLGNVEVALNCGDLIGVTKGEYKGKFRVTWIGKKGSCTQGQIGIECPDGPRNIWGIEDYPYSESDERAGAQRRHCGFAFTGERRNTPRYPCDIGVQIRQPGSEVSLWCRCTDISEGGCYVDSRSPLVAGTKFHVSMFFDTESLVVPVIVRTSFPGMGMGVEFDFESDEQRVQLRRYLREKLGADTGSLETEDATIPAVERLSQCIDQLRAWIASTPLDNHDRNELEVLASSLRRELRGIRAEISERVLQRKASGVGVAAGK